MLKKAKNSTLENRQLYVFFLLCFCQLSIAQNKQTFEVEAANTFLNDTVFFLNAYIAIELPSYIEQAVEQGFDLPLKIEVDIFRHRTFWFDARIVKIKLRYILQYSPLLESYTLQDVNSGTRRFYSTQKEALSQLGTFYNFALLDNNSLDPEQSYRCQIRFAIDQEQLPIPLKSSSLWDNDWNLSSDWYSWDITQ